HYLCLSSRRSTTQLSAGLPFTIYSNPSPSNFDLFWTRPQFYLFLEPEEHERLDGLADHRGAQAGVCCETRKRSQLPLEGLVEDGGEHGVQLSISLALQRVHHFDPGMKGVKFLYHALLMMNWWQDNRNSSQTTERNFSKRRSFACRINRFTCTPGLKCPK